MESIEIVQNGSKQSNALLSFDYKKIHSHDLEIKLSNRNIILRTGHMCSQTTLRELGKVSLNRVSWGIGVTEQNIESFLKALKEIDNTL
jgi:selenocysteine lyase/cysteine desulfurase